MQVFNKWQINTDEHQATRMWIEGQVKRGIMLVQLHAETGLTARTRSSLAQR